MQHARNSAAGWRSGLDAAAWRHAGLGAGSSGWQSGGGAAGSRALAAAVSSWLAGAADGQMGRHSARNGKPLYCAAASSWTGSGGRRRRQQLGRCSSMHQAAVSGRGAACWRQAGRAPADMGARVGGETCSPDKKNLRLTLPFCLPAAAWTYNPAGGRGWRGHRQI